MNNQNTPPHAELVVRLDRHIIGVAGTAVKAEIKGCKECLSSAITLLLLHDQGFKELINKSIRAANEIKGRTQN